MDLDRSTKQEQAVKDLQETVTALLQLTDTLNRELKKVKDDLKETKDELNRTKDGLSRTKDELNRTKAQSSNAIKTLQDENEKLKKQIDLLLRPRQSLKFKINKKK